MSHVGASGSYALTPQRQSPTLRNTSMKDRDDVRIAYLGAAANDDANRLRHISELRSKLVLPPVRAINRIGYSPVAATPAPSK